MSKTSLVARFKAVNKILVSKLLLASLAILNCCTPYQPCLTTYLETPSSSCSNQEDGRYYSKDGKFSIITHPAVGTKITEECFEDRSIVDIENHFIGFYLTYAVQMIPKDFFCKYVFNHFSKQALFSALICKGVLLDYQKKSPEIRIVAGEYLSQPGEEAYIAILYLPPSFRDTSARYQKCDFLGLILTVKGQNIVLITAQQANVTYSSSKDAMEYFKPLLLQLLDEVIIENANAIQPCELTLPPSEDNSNTETGDCPLNLWEVACK